MRLLHTSDWHLGQHFMGQTRQAEHAALIDWLLAQVDIHTVDAVLIAGDVFDTGAPPSYARGLYNQLIGRLCRAGVALLVLGGNHDSVSVLGEHQPLLAQLNAHVVAAVDADAAQHVLTLPQRGDTATPGCIVCALPFIRARDVVQSDAGQSAADKQLALQNAIQSTYARVFAAAQALQADHLAQTGQRLPIVATGHLTTVGASRSESVREIYVGALEAFPTSAFPPADYIALGHIHQPQKVGGLQHVRYSGSPIALSFDEARQAKQVLLVDLGAQGVQCIEALPVPAFQPLAAISGSLTTLPAALQSAAAPGTAERPVWLEVTVQEDDYLPDLAARVDALTEALPVHVLRVRRQRGAAAPQLAGEGGESLHELSPHDVFALRLAQETLTPELHSALATRYHQVLADLTSGEASGATDGAAA